MSAGRFDLWYSLGGLTMNQGNKISHKRGTEVLIWSRGRRMFGSAKIRSMVFRTAVGNLMHHTCDSASCPDHMKTRQHSRLWCPPSTAE